MKIRSSFVSNSSSASYIITINKEKSEFVMECLREYAHSYFYEKDFAALIEKRISAGCRFWLLALARSTSAPSVPAAADLKSAAPSPPLWM